MFHCAGGYSTLMRERLQQLLGVDLTTIPTIGLETALVFAAEVGPDLSRFPSSAHFCSWLTLAPHTRISGGKRLSGRVRAPGHRSCVSRASQPASQGWPWLAVRRRGHRGAPDSAPRPPNRGNPGQRRALRRRTDGLVHPGEGGGGGERRERKREL